MKKSLLIIGIVSLISTSSFAQTEQKESKYAVETDILWPFLVQTTRTHFTFKLWEKGNLRGDVYVGLNIDFPRDRATEGRFAVSTLPTTSCPSQLNFPLASNSMARGRLCC